MQTAKETIGWKEVVDLPVFGLRDVPAKVDTGARTSVLHCSHIQLIESEGGTFVEFIPLDCAEEHFATARKFTLPFHSERLIKNSFGQEENRYIVKTNIRLGDQEFDIEISLRDRSGMEFPILLGRSFIRGKFVVDVSKSYLRRKKSRKS